MAVRVGVIGTGVMGADHVRILGSMVSRATVSAVTDLDLGRAREVARRVGARVIDTPDALIEDADVDAVLVASSDRTHEGFVLACLDADKPVLCEKPLTPTPEAALRIVGREVDRGRRTVSVGFMRRYDPGFVAVKQALTDGAIAEPLMIHCVHRNASSRPNAPTAGLIHGSAVHEIDATRWLLGEEIARVTVHRGRRSSRVVGETADPLLCVFETESGVVVDVEVFVNAQYGYEVRCEVVGETGTVMVDEPPQAVLRSAQRRTTSVAYDWRDRFAEAYRRELQDWIDGIVAGDPQRGASAWDGYAATAVAAAGVEALATGAIVEVKLESRPALYG